MSKNTLKEWDLYEAGIKYNNALILGDKSYYDKVDVDLAFASGDQWRNVEAEDISKPVVPIIQKARQHTIANVCSTNISATIQPLEYASEEERTPEMMEEIETTEIANAEIRNIFDQIKYEFLVRDGVGDAFDMGDMCMHFYWDAKEKPLKGSKYANMKGKLCCELVDGPNVMFGNANNPDPQIQPYIIVIGREVASVLKEEAKEYKINSKGENIEEDSDYDYQAGDNGKIELDTDKYGKALYIIVYTKNKKTGTIKATKCVQNAYIYKDIDTELTKYPVAWMNFKKQKNQYHGASGVSGLIPNQISINKLIAMVIYNAMNTSFPKFIYNKEKMNGPTNQIGETIGLERMQPGESVREAAAFLTTGDVSPSVITIINLLIDVTKDMLGINDAAVGNVNPDNTSAMALAEKLTSVPLENVRSNLYNFTEQVVDIILDFMSVKYGIRYVTIKDGDNSRIVEYDFSKMKDLNTSKRIDVGAIGYSSELTSLKELKDLLNMGAITTVDYLERLPEYTIPQVKELVEEIKARMGIVSAKDQLEKSKSYEGLAQFMESLPIEQQEELRKLPDDQLEQALTELMAQAPNMQMQEQEIQANQNLNSAIGDLSAQ